MSRPPDVLDRIRAADPVREADLPAPHAADAARFRAAAPRRGVRPPRRRPVGVLAGLAGLAALAGVLVLAVPRGSDGPAGGSAPREPERVVPGRAAERPLQLLDPGPLAVPRAGLSLRALRGRWVVLSLGASWCAPCQRMRDDLDVLARGLGPDVVTVLVAANDRARDARADLLPNRRGYAVARDPEPGSLTDALGVARLPVTILFDPSGRVVLRRDGPTLTGIAAAIGAATPAPRRDALAAFWDSPAGAGWRTWPARTPGMAPCRAEYGAAGGATRPATCATWTDGVDGTVVVGLVQVWRPAGAARPVFHEWRFTVRRDSTVAGAGQGGDAPPRYVP